eukprot:CAMPEP_0169087534 /NCGR_PEP_ID=MMETSP1015-20121227/14281_1 /TAXON_ID=342587 /ORGANISM="Karlodinium micrum, Strain CCMP2283" /LENGTH=354 /DNA_ID=CAMNT_0009147767 /DNA_START=73 /DNA_END=1137 /DNA_ORIENTATION=+
MSGQHLHQSIEEGVLPSPCDVTFTGFSFAGIHPSVLYPTLFSLSQHAGAPLPAMHSFPGYPLIMHNAMRKEEDANQSDRCVGYTFSRDGVTQKNIWQLSRCRDTTQVVQTRLRNCTNDQEFNRLAIGLRNHVWEASKDPHANHVVQVLIEKAGAETEKWIFGEMCDTSKDGGIVKAAKHRYQCRIVQRMLEYFSLSLVKAIGDYILADLVETRNLCSHMFGNYVMSSLLERGTVEQFRSLMKLLIACFDQLGKENHGASVLACAVRSVADEEHTKALKEALALAILANESLVLESMAFSRFGHLTIKYAIEMLLDSHPKQANECLARLKDAEDKLRAGRYGRALAAFVDAKRQD